LPPCPLDDTAYTIAACPLPLNTPMNPAGSVLLADDHDLVRHGLQLLIAEVLPQLRVQLASSLAETVQALQTLGRFDLVLLDLTLSDVPAGRSVLAA
jgi:CheY-like chemotaxis protein